MTATVLAPDCGESPDHGQDAVEGGARPLLLGAVLRVPDVADADRRAVPGRDNEVVEVARVDDAAHRAQRLLARVARHVAAREIGVLPRERVSDGRDGELVRREPAGVHPDVDRALEAADDRDFPDAARSLEHRPTILSAARQLRSFRSADSAIVMTGARCCPTCSRPVGASRAGSPARTPRDPGRPVSPGDVALQLERR
jgi:hypothetical protein